MISKKIFIAPDVFLAFIDRSHIKHLQSVTYFDFFASEKYLVFTNIITINQTYNIIRQRMSPSIARDFLKSVLLGNINILYPDEADVKIALKALIQNQSGNLTLEEAIICVLCDKRNISQICTFSYFHQLFGLQLFYMPV